MRLWVRETTVNRLINGRFSFCRAPKTMGSGTKEWGDGAATGRLPQKNESAANIKSATSR